ncbi:hypothetical protein JCM10914A_35800 [Paenibacillus sp. JCM 10914]|uniref:YhcN/YlaJ family sporulation lipoprotein n=1 Tax=Paenibacillus sp. JCM 10914 TaxID=1236974 RepID=UPI0003CC7D4F|nr:YhcN/YlaJ family sporulation lipoprotein [Paenibacillus sp. JCM 10914]GAE04227.1 IG hypothetical protein 17041 [Paenibacillus sp. JCM 10914]
MKIALSLMLTVLLLAGCGNMNNNASPSPRNQHNGTTAHNAQDMNGTRNHVNHWKGNVSDTNNGQIIDENDENVKVDPTTANHLKSLAEHVPGVENANCVVMGNTAVVGLNVDGNLDRAQVGSIKYTVAEALQSDPAGANALVTADMDITNRITELGRHIQEGHPVSGIATELADIVGRIIPQLPEDVTPRDGEADDEEQTVTPSSREKVKAKKIKPHRNR